MKEKRLHLDTNSLIDLLIQENKTLKIVKEKVLSGWNLEISAMVWHEFVCGPVVEEEKRDIWDLIEGRVVPMDFEIAELAASIFNQIGRKKGSKPDCIIAATAIHCRANLLTWNLEDFKRIKKLGFELELVL